MADQKYPLELLRRRINHPLHVACRIGRCTVPAAHAITEQPDCRAGGRLRRDIAELEDTKEPAVPISRRVICLDAAPVRQDHQVSCPRW